MTDANKEAKALATWSEGMEVDARGFGPNLPPNQSREGWLHTRPLAIGTAWRPAGSATINVILKLAETSASAVRENAAYFTPQVFVRYSPDAKHWSTWQVLKAITTAPDLTFTGSILVPQKQRAEYDRLLQAYAKLDVPWKSDEDAAVKWIVRNDAQFFERNLPFVGYVEFLVDAYFPSDLSIVSFQGNAGWGIGGGSAIPKDGTLRAHPSGPWAFKGGEPKASKEPKVLGR